MLRFLIIGSGKVSADCARRARARGHEIVAVLPLDEHLADWSAAQGIPRIDRLDEAPAADVLISIAYRHILSDAQLGRFPLCLNCHDGQIPRFAGRNCPTWALLEGQTEHSVTWHEMVAEVDAGRIWAQERISIGPGETSLSLNLQCHAAAQRGFEQVLDHVEQKTPPGDAPPSGPRKVYKSWWRPQDGAWLNPAQPPEQIVQTVHALDFGDGSNPLTYPKIRIDGRWFAVGRAEVDPAPKGNARLERSGDELVLATRSKTLRLSKLQPIDGGSPELPRGPLQFSAQEGLQLKQCLERAAKAEASWIEELRDIEPYNAHRRAPGAPGAQLCIALEAIAPRLSAALEVDRERALLALVLLLLQRLRFTEGSRGCVALHGPAPDFCRPFERLFLPFIPFVIAACPSLSVRESTTALLDQLERTTRRGPPLRELFLRDPRLDAEVMERLSVHVGVTSVPERGALTIRIQDDRMHFSSPEGQLCLQDLRALANELELLGNAMLTTADERLDAVSIVPPEESQLLLQAGDGGPLPSLSARSTIDLFEETARRFPEHDAIACEKTGVVSYRTLDQRANRWAHALSERGIFGQVAIAYDQGLDWITAILAAWKAGLAFVALDPAQPRARLARALEDAACTTVLTQLDLPGACALEVQQRPPNAPPRTTRLEDPAYVYFTSGSTGHPKGALNTHRGALLQCLAFQDRLGLQPEDRVLLTAPVGFDVSLQTALHALISGACLVIPDPLQRADLSALGARIRDNKITVLNTVPTMLSYLASEDLGGVRVIQVGAERLSPELAEAFVPARRLINTYGPTEASVYATTYEVTAPVQRPVPIGRAIPGARMLVLHKDQLAPFGVTGELAISGDTVGLGYINAEDAGVFTVDPLDEDRRLYRTGDLGCLSRDGLLHFVGRRDHQVKIRGQRIECSEIEASLLAHPAVTQAVVLAVTHEDELELRAYWSGDQVPNDKLHRHLQAQLPAVMRPATLQHLAVLPQSPNGKIDRRALARLPRPQPLEPPKPPISGRLARRVQDAFCEVLRLPPTAVGLHDDFFELGGHSLAALTLSNKLSGAFGVELGLAKVLMRPTVFALSEALEALEPARPVLQGLPIEGWAPLSSSQLFFWMYNLGRKHTTLNPLLVVTVEGPMDRARLETAYNQVIARQSALWMRIDRVRPRQRPCAPTWATISYRDLSNARKEQTAQLDRDALAWLSHIEPALTHPPLCALRLVRLDQDRHALLLMMPHLIADYVAAQLLMTQLLAAYDGAETPQVTRRLEVLAHQDRSRLTDALIRQARSKAKARLGEASALLIPQSCWRRDGLASSEHRARLSAQADRYLLAQMTSAKATAVPLFMTLFSRALRRLYNAKDFGLAAVVMDRPLHAMETIACMINFVAVRATPNERVRFQEELEQLQRRYVCALDESLELPEIIDLIACQPPPAHAIQARARRWTARALSAAWDVPPSLLEAYLEHLGPRAGVRSGFGSIQAFVNVLPGYYKAAPKSQDKLRIVAQRSLDRIRTGTSSRGYAYLYVDRIDGEVELSLRSTLSPSAARSLMSTVVEIAHGEAPDRL